MIIQGDCLEEMKYIADKSIDMILCDLPYGVTKNKWDSIICLQSLWAHYERIIKDNGAIVLFGQDKFSARLILSNEKIHRYNLVWHKTSATGFLNAKKMPLRAHEDILVFYKKLPIYNPQKTTGHKRKVSTVAHKRNSKLTTNYGDHSNVSTYDSTERYPTSILRYARDTQKSSLYPTQKPVALLENLILTFTNKGDIVLDNACGSGGTGEAADNTGRDFILIDNCPNAISITKKRLSI